MLLLNNETEIRVFKRPYSEKDLPTRCRHYRKYSCGYSIELCVRPPGVFHS